MRPLAGPDPRSIEPSEHGRENSRDGEPQIASQKPKGIGFATSTQTFPNGDQIYARGLTRTQCALGGGRVTSVDTFSIVGGTGKFEGASGTFEVSYSSFFQVFDGNAVPPQGFGSFSGEFEGTITLP